MRYDAKGHRTSIYIPQRKGWHIPALKSGITLSRAWGEKPSTATAGRVLDASALHSNYFLEPAPISGTALQRYGIAMQRFKKH